MTHNYFSFLKEGYHLAQGSWILFKSERTMCVNESAFKPFQTRCIIQLHPGKFRTPVPLEAEMLPHPVSSPNTQPFLRRSKAWTAGGIHEGGSSNMLSLFWVWGLSVMATLRLPFRVCEWACMRLNVSMYGHEWVRVSTLWGRGKHAWACIVAVRGRRKYVYAQL